jgi:phage terminase small subunit
LRDLRLKLKRRKRIKLIDNYFMITKRQQLFVKEYLVDMNASAAARRAGYSVKNADKIGSQLLGKTRVAEQIRIATEARTNKLDIKADVVLQELAKNSICEHW